MTVHKTDIWLDMLINFSKQIGNSFTKIINTKVNSKPNVFFFFNFFSTLNKSLRFTRFRKSYVNRIAVVPTNYYQSHTAFLPDVSSIVFEVTTIISSMFIFFSQKNLKRTKMHHKQKRNKKTKISEQKTTKPTIFCMHKIF